MRKKNDLEITMTEAEVAGEVNQAPDGRKIILFACWK